MKRQSLRRGLLLVSLLLFPVTLNFLSPYLIVVGASQGVVTGSFLAFAAMFVSAFLVGRGFCGWVCPGGGLQDACVPVNGHRVDGRGDWLKYAIWLLWLLGIAGAAAYAGGLTRISPLFMTESGVSIDAPERFVIYYGVLFIFVELSFVFGRRAGCHYICWMAPFMVVGKKLRDAVRIPTLHLRASTANCGSCGACTRGCPMSVDVRGLVLSGRMETPECILCGECVDGCPRGAIHYSFGRVPKAARESEGMPDRP